MSRERLPSPEAPPGAAACTRATFTLSAQPMCSRLSPSQNRWHCSFSRRRLHERHKASLRWDTSCPLRPPVVRCIALAGRSSIAACIQPRVLTSRS